MILVGSVIDRTLTCSHCNKKGLYRVKRNAALNALFFWVPLKRYECMHCEATSYHFKIFTGGSLKMEPNDAGYGHPANRRKTVKPYI
jgi:DNA-directed RNA polymerase subunit RPC12/RpoP